MFSSMALEGNAGLGTGALLPGGEAGIGLRATDPAWPVGAARGVDHR